MLDLRNRKTGGCWRACRSWARIERSEARNEDCEEINFSFSMVLSRGYIGQMRVLLR